MNKTQYSRLEPEQKLALWRELTQSDGWQLFKEEVLNLLESKYKAVRSLDEERAFYFQSVKEAAMREVLAFPESRIAGLEQGLRQGGQTNANG